MGLKKENTTIKSLSKIILEVGMTISCKNKSDLITAVWKHCQDNNLLHNKKGTNITTISIRNCLNEIIRYIVSKKRGCWKNYKIIDNDHIFKIEKEVKYIGRKI